MDKNLFEVSLTGNVQALNELLKKDELILDRVSLTRFNETPLHIAAMRGHLEFAKFLLLKKPTLAMSLDSTRRTPLHVASAGGHAKVVHELLRVTGAEGCGFRDQDGRTPLYFAVKNEELDIIKLLIQTNPDVGREMQENGETILHRCIYYNSFEALKLLCELWNEDELAMLADHNGNTLLHLAVAHKQVQTVKYLLQKQSIRTNRNIVNGHGFTTLDVLDHRPRDFKALEVQTLLMEANFARAKDVKSFKSSIKSNSSQNVTNLERKPKGLMSRIWNWYLNNNENWLEKQRGTLILVTIVIAILSFYSGLHPPGGTFTDSRDGPPGNSIQAELYMESFNFFLIENTIIMVVSQMILVVLLSGISLRNKFCLWVLNLATLCIIFFVIVEYLTVIAHMSPDSWVNEPTIIMCFAWMLLCMLFAFIHTIFFITWVVKKLLIRARTRTRNNDLVNSV